MMQKQSPAHPPRHEQSSAHPRRHDLTGQRFGSLVAVAPTDENKHGYVIWRCRCDCGNECKTPSRYLKQGWSTSCGCTGRKRRHQDLTGQRFGKLVVQQQAYETTPDGKRREVRNKNGCIMWECRCDCGSTVLAPTGQLVAGYRKSCNCLSKPPLKDWVGKRFGKLTVTGYAGKWNAVHHWKCRCDCGTVKTVCQSNLKNGHTTSCGCMVRPFASRNCIGGTCIELIRSRKVFKSNTSGVRGVYPIHKTGKWAAQIQFRGEKTYLGTYDTIEEAKQVRERAEIVFDQFLARFEAGELDEEIRPAVKNIV